MCDLACSALMCDQNIQAKKDTRAMKGRAQNFAASSCTFKLADGLFVLPITYSIGIWKLFRLTESRSYQIYLP